MSQKLREYPTYAEDYCELAPPSVHLHAKWMGDNRQTLHKYNLSMGSALCRENHSPRWIYVLSHRCIIRSRYEYELEMSLLDSR
jgi:hypothetical protein